jgi:hypothetical protein
MSVTIVNRSGVSVYYQFCRAEPAARRQSMKIGPIRMLKSGERAVEPAPRGLTEYKLGFGFGITYTPLVSQPLLSVAYDPMMVCTPESTNAKLPFDEFGAAVPSYAVAITKSVDPLKPAVTVISGPKIAGGGGGGVTNNIGFRQVRRRRSHPTSLPPYGTLL